MKWLLQKTGLRCLSSSKRKNVRDIVLLNYRLPDAAGRPPADIGLVLLRFIKKESPKTVVVMFTGYTAVDVAFQAGCLGAFAYITKPFENEKLIETLDSAIEHRKSLQQNIKPPPLISENESLTTMQQIERDAIFQAIRENGGNILETSKRLGIGRQTLYNKIKAYGIEV